MPERFNCHEWRIPEAVAMVIFSRKGRWASVEDNIDYALPFLREGYRERAEEILSSQDREIFIRSVRSSFASIQQTTPGP